MPDSSIAILLIEENQPTRELYQRELSRDFKVFACDSENEALALLHCHAVNAIVLEPALRSGQGWSFLAMLRDMAQTRAIPVILCSTMDERRRGLELGAALCLTKPVLPVVLSEVIRQVIGRASGSF